MDTFIYRRGRFIAFLALLLTFSSLSHGAIKGKFLYGALTDRNHQQRTAENFHWLTSDLLEKYKHHRFQPEREVMLSVISDVATIKHWRDDDERYFEAQIRDKISNWDSAIDENAPFINNLHKLVDEQGLGLPNLRSVFVKAIPYLAAQAILEEPMVIVVKADAENQIFDTRTLYPGTDITTHLAVEKAILNGPELRKKLEQTPLILVLSNGDLTYANKHRLRKLTTPPNSEEELLAAIHKRATLSEEQKQALKQMVYSGDYPQMQTLNNHLEAGTLLPDSLLPHFIKLMDKLDTRLSTIAEDTLEQIKRHDNTHPPVLSDEMQKIMSLTSDENFKMLDLLFSITDSCLETQSYKLQSKTTLVDAFYSDFLSDVFKVLSLFQYFMSDPFLFSIISQFDDFDQFSADVKQFEDNLMMVTPLKCYSGLCEDVSERDAVNQIFHRSGDEIMRILLMSGAIPVDRVTGKIERTQTSIQSGRNILRLEAGATSSQIARRARYYMAVAHPDKNLPEHKKLTNDLIVILKKAKDVLLDQDD